MRIPAFNTVPPHTSPENFYLTFETHFRSPDSNHKISPKMAPKLSEEEIDDLIYFSRAGELADLEETLKSLSEREGASVGEIITAAKDEGKSTCLHMAAGNGHLGKSLPHLCCGNSPKFETDSLYRYCEGPHHSLRQPSCR